MLFFHSVLFLLGVSSKARAHARSLQTTSSTTCEVEPLQVDGEPELFGYNWELFDQAVVVNAGDDGNDLGVDYIEIVKDASETRPSVTKAFAQTIQSFQRPLTVSADMRLKPGTEKECLTLGVFGTPGCFADFPAKRYKCGYVGAPFSLGEDFSTQAHEFGFPQYRTGVLSDENLWHNVKIDLLQDGTTKFYLNDTLMDTKAEPTIKQYGGSYNEGHITFWGCATGQYKNLKVVGSQCVTESVSLGADWMIICDRV